MNLNIFKYIIFIIALSQFLSANTINAGQRRLSVGEQIPEFSATDVNGNIFNYRHNSGKVSIISFLSDEQKGSRQAATDIKAILQSIGENARKIQTIIVIEDPNSAHFQSIKENQAADLHVLLDSEYKLWGKFGIIATPTVIISDTNDIALSVQSGHGYDFVPVVRSNLNKALGIQEATFDAADVKTVVNDSVTARLTRHLQMAKLLEEKGRIEAAIAEVRRAEKLDPNSNEVKLELGKLLCMSDQSRAALKVINDLKTTKKVELARILLIKGWANRKLNELDNAEQFLTEAIAMNPQSTRALFELGKLYQAKGQTDKAMESYYKALTIIFNESGENKPAFQQ